MHNEMALMFAANRKKNDARKRGGGDYTGGVDYTPAEKLSIANNEGGLMEGMEGGISYDPGGGGSSSQKATFVQGKYQC